MSTAAMPNTAPMAASYLPTSETSFVCFLCQLISEKCEGKSPVGYSDFPIGEVNNRSTNCTPSSSKVPSIIGTGVKLPVCNPSSAWYVERLSKI